MTYSLKILPSAERQLGSLDSVPYDSVKRRIYSLQDNARPPGCRKLADLNAWRVRAGDYRVIYEIDDATRTITVVKIGHRREIYR